MRFNWDGRDRRGRLVRAGRCSYRLAGSRMLRLAAGPQRLPIGRSVAGVRLRAGTWRVMLSTPKAIVSVSVTVRSR